MPFSFVLFLSFFNVIICVCFAVCYVLRCKTWLFAVQKAVFYSLKGHLLQLKHKPAVLLTTCILPAVRRA